MIRARECALDETCTVEYAGIYLDELSHIRSDEDVINTMIRARECALDETCTVEYAGIYLDELSHIRSDGSIAFRGANVSVSDIIEMLREKINKGIVLEEEDEDISHIVFASIFAFSIATIVL